MTVFYFKRWCIRWMNSRTCALKAFNLFTCCKCLCTTQLGNADVRELQQAFSHVHENILTYRWGFHIGMMNAVFVIHKHRSILVPKLLWRSSNNGTVILQWGIFYFPCTSCILSAGYQSHHHYLRTRQLELRKD